MAMESKVGLSILAALIIAIAMIRVTLTPIWTHRADIPTIASHSTAASEQPAAPLSPRRENSW